MTQLKICRVNDPDTCIELFELGVRYVGFHAIDDCRNENAQKLAKVNRFLSEAGYGDRGVLLTKSLELRSIFDLVHEGNFQLLQVHRSVRAEEFAMIDNMAEAAGIETILMVAPTCPQDESSRNRADWILVDHSRGGTGDEVPEEFIQTLDNANLFIAGGISASNVAQKIQRFRPYAVDVQSAVELMSKYEKDLDKVKELIDTISAADADMGST